MPPESVLVCARPPFGQIHEFQQLVDSRLPLLRGNIVELGVDAQIFLDGEIEVTGQRLGNHADSTSRRIRILADIVAGNASPSAK